MEIRNLIVNNKKVYLDILIRELIKLEISYVLVDNYEIHFDNCIIRLYELEEILSNLIKDSEDIINVDFSTLDNSLDFLNIHNRFKEPKLEIFKSVDEIDIKPIDKTPKYTKKMIKQQNRYYSNKINTKKK